MSYSGFTRSNNGYINKLKINFLNVT